VLSEGWIQDEVDPAEQVREGILEGQPDHQADHPYTGRQQAHVNPGVLQHQHQRNHEKYERPYCVNKGHKKVVNLDFGLTRMPFEPAEDDLFDDSSGQVEAHRYQHYRIEAVDNQADVRAKPQL
jgi:hypothetical protein